MSSPPSARAEFYQPHSRFWVVGRCFGWFWRPRVSLSLQCTRLWALTRFPPGRLDSKRKALGSENEWAFGQVLAVLLLGLPILATLGVYHGKFPVGYYCDWVLLTRLVMVEELARE